MSFLDNLFGGKAKKNDAKKGYNESNDILNSGLTSALADRTGAYGAARNTVNAGYGTALDYTNRGYEAAGTNVRAGYDDAKTTAGSHLDRATGYLDPFVRSGYGAQNKLDDYYGVNGSTAQGDVARNFADANNPLTAYRDEMATKQIDAAYNARGLGTSGRAATAVGRASLERKAQDFDSYIANVNRGADRGLSAATTSAGMTKSTGDILTQMDAQRGRDLADLDTRGAGARSGLAVGQTNALAGLDVDEGTGSADLIYGNAQQRAGNRINLGNAYAATRGTGMNNLAQIAGTAIQGFTPGLSGVSAFGNMARHAGYAANNLGRPFIPSFG